MDFKELPKYIIYNTRYDQYFYHPIIFKWEWDGWPHAYYAMYARFYPTSGFINPSQVLFYAKSSTYNEVVEKFHKKYTEMAKFVKGNIWMGEPPLKIDLSDKNL